MVVNRSLKESTSFRLQPRSEGVRFFRISPVTGKESELGGEGNCLASGAGVLARVDIHERR